MTTTADDEQQGNMEKAARAEKREADFRTKAALIAALRRKGSRTTDKNPTSLQLRVSPKGVARWYYRFRDKEGKLVEGTLKFDAVPEDGDGRLTLDYEQAKAHVERVKVDATKSDAEKHVDEKTKRFKTLKNGFDYYLENRITTRDRPLSPETKADYQKVFRNYLEINLFPTKYSKPPSEWLLAEVDDSQWRELLKEIQKRSLAKARNCSAIISGIYGMGVAEKVLASNPINSTRYLRTLPKLPKREGSIETVNLPGLFDAIDENIARQSSKDAILLIAMTGMRLRAALGMRWSQLSLDDNNLEGGMYFVKPDQPGWKGFTGVLPLSTFVVELLKSRRERRRPGDSDYVFRAHHGISSPHQIRLDDAMKAISVGFSSKASAQHLRRTFATITALCFNDNTRKVAALMTHNWAVTKENMVVTQDAVTRGYIQSTMKGLLLAANTATGFILELGKRKPLSERTKQILGQEDPECLQLLNLSEANEEEALQSELAKSESRGVDSE